MEKILIEIKLPAADMTYDVFVPNTMQIGMLTKLAASVFAGLSNGTYIPSVYSTLCEQETGKIYDSDIRVANTDIHHGTKLFLI